MARRLPNPPADPELKARALALADEIGPAKAAREMGIPEGTLRGWRTKLGQAGPPQGVDRKAWAESKRAGAAETWTAAQEALRNLQAALAKGKTMDAQRLAVTAGICVDKATVWERSAVEQEARERALAQERAELVRDVFEAGLDGLGVPPSERRSMLALFADLLRQVTGERSDVLVTNPELAHRASAGLREHFIAPERARLAAERERILAEVRAMIEPEWRARPALTTRASDAEAGELAQPRQVWSHAVPVSKPEPPPAASRGRVVRPVSVADQVRAERGYGTSEFS